MRKWDVHEACCLERCRSPPAPSSITVSSSAVAAAVLGSTVRGTVAIAAVVVAKIVHFEVTVEDGYTAGRFHHSFEEEVGSEVPVR